MMSTCSDHGSLEVVDEGPLEVLPGVDGVWFKAFEPSEGCGVQGYWEVECLSGVGSARYLDGDGVAMNPLARVLLAVVLEDADWFEVLRVGLAGDVGGEYGEAVTIIGIVISVRPIPSPCLNDVPRVATIVDLLPSINHRSILEASLWWSFTLRPCIMPGAGWVHRLLHLLFDLATRKLLAVVIAVANWIVLVTLAIVVPLISKTSSRGATNLRKVTMALRSRERVPS
jgi:hypothetical protein